jgi:hypothetical protein
MENFRMLSKFPSAQDDEIVVASRSRRLSNTISCFLVLFQGELRILISEAEISLFTFSTDSSSSHSMFFFSFGVFTVTEMRFELPSAIEVV